MDSEYAKGFLDTSHPLLKEFREKAPGSFKHCQNVSSICAEIAKRVSDIDDDALTLAAAYHDIGKMFNPEWFSENQKEKNPHDKAEACESYQMISRHVSDSAFLMVQHEFPPEVIKIASEHHGNTVMRFFYEKAQAGNAKNGNEISSDSFRYLGQKPSTDEAAILIIVDAVEATAKSEAPLGKLDSEEDKIGVIERMVNVLDGDDQLDRLNLGTLKVVKTVLLEELTATYHNRVDYDEENNGDSKEDEEDDE